MIPDAPVLDILSKQTTYLHISLPDAHRLIYDISDCTYIGTAPNQDGTLTAYKAGGEQVVLEPIRRME
jgi:hypothetical protein